MSAKPLLGAIKLQQRQTNRYYIYHIFVLVLILQLLYLPMVRTLVPILLSNIQQHPMR